VITVREVATPSAKNCSGSGFDNLQNLGRSLKMRKQKLVCGLTLALSVSGLFAGCAVERKCGLQGCAGDAQITEKVESLFNEHPEIGTEVNVQTLNHVVYLSGLVSAGEIRTTAEDVAGTAPGVSKVVDTIAVSR
jgi:osmotically-inducible protein OsmY